MIIIKYGYVHKKISSKLILLFKFNSKINTKKHESNLQLKANL